MATPLTLPASSPAATKAALEALLRERKLRADAPPLRGEDRRGRARARGGRGGGGGVPPAGAPPAPAAPLPPLDPASAAAAGVTLPRLLWLRGPRVEDGGPKALAEAAAAGGAAPGPGGLGGRR